MGQEIISEDFEGLPAVTSEEMRVLDRMAEDRFGLLPESLMENAGRAVGEATERFLEGSQNRFGVVACGRGSNGGDGLVASRFLSLKKIPTSVFLCPPKKDETYPPLIALNLKRAQEAGVKIVIFENVSAFATEIEKASVILDALLGTGSSGRPTGAVHSMIQEIVRSKKNVLSVDIPSGIHPDTGHHSGSFITATETFSLGLPKRGLLFPHSQKNVGRLRVLDIGYPKELVSSVIGLRGLSP